MSSKVAADFTAAVESGRLDLPRPGSGRTGSTAAGGGRCGCAPWSRPPRPRPWRGPAGRSGPGRCATTRRTRRVADLTVYLRQHHAEKDLAELGTLAAEAGAAW